MTTWREAMKQTGSSRSVFTNEGTRAVISMENGRFCVEDIDHNDNNAIWVNSPEGVDLTLDEFHMAKSGYYVPRRIRD